MDRVGTRSASHSKSLERRFQRAVCMFLGGYYTRCAEPMDCFTHAVETEATCLYYVRTIVDGNRSINGD